MLTLSESQMTTFQQAQSDALVVEIATYLRLEAPEAVETASCEELHEFVSTWIDKASSHGIADSYLIQQLCLFAIWLGPDFENDPNFAPAGEALRNAAISPDDRIARIEDFIMADWPGAR